MNESLGDGCPGETGYGSTQGLGISPDGWKGWNDLAPREPQEQGY